LQKVGTNITGDLAYEGLWHIQDGLLVATITNVPNLEPNEVVSKIKRYKIITIETQKMILLPEGHTNLITISKT
jgi:hypothetical protein